MALVKVLVANLFAGASLQSWRLDGFMMSMTRSLKSGLSKAG